MTTRHQFSQKQYRNLTIKNVYFVYSSTIKKLHFESRCSVPSLYLLLWAYYAWRTLTTCTGNAFRTRMYPIEHRLCARVPVSWILEPKEKDNRMSNTQTCRWQFPKSDCGYDDVHPQPSCSHRGLHDLDALKKCCLATAGCGGFNTNGIIKKTDCLSHKKPEPLCDLYVKESSPQPAPRAPVPIWPAPKKYSRGNTTRTIDSSRFKLLSATTKGSSDPFLPAAFARYNPGLLFPHTQGPDATKAPAMALQVTRPYPPAFLNPTHTHMHTCTINPTHTHIPTCTLNPTYVHTINTHTHTHTHTHVRTHARTQAHAHIQTYTYTYTHARAHKG